MSGSSSVVNVPNLMSLGMSDDVFFMIQSMAIIKKY